MPDNEDTYGDRHYNENCRSKIAVLANCVNKCWYAINEKNKPKNILRLLQSRELGHQEPILRRSRCRIALSSLEYYKPKCSKNSKTISKEPIDVYNTIYLGLSHDSNKLAALKQSEIIDNENYIGREFVNQHLNIYDLSPSLLLTRASVLLGRRDSLTHLYGLFPLSNAFFASISFNDSHHKTFTSSWYESMVTIDLILLRHSLYLSMTTFYRISCRSKKKPSSGYLRPFNNGVMINTGASVISLWFVDKYPALFSNHMRRVFALLNLQSQNCCVNGENLQNISAKFYSKYDEAVEIVEISDKEIGGNSIIYLIESFIPVENLIKKVVTKHITSSIPDCTIMGVVDYESDILEVSDSVCLLSFAAVIEANHMGANCIFLKSTFCCRWLHQATNSSLVSIPNCYIERIGWQVANNPRKWYTPVPYSLKQSQDQILTNENVFTDESLKLLTSQFSGIELTL